MLRQLAFMLCTTAVVAAEPLALSALPDGALRTRVAGLAPQARERALRTLGRSPGLLAEAAHLRVGADGSMLVDNCLAIGPGAPRVAAAPAVAGAAVPVANQPAYSSRPGAACTLFIDFNGHTVTGTAWNVDSLPSYDAETTYVAKPFTLDGDDTTFSDAEQESIRLIWARVAEDFRPFDINVTTVEPATFGPLVGRALVTSKTDANGNTCPYGDTSGGVAYVGVFGETDYQTYAPAWVYYDQVASEEAYIADVVAHEFGHNLSLSHDGQTNGNGYYSGHGSGYTWGPIMGAPYGMTVTQWSKGEYTLANNTQDDLAIITGLLGALSDDHGGTTASATSLSFTAGAGATRDVAGGTGGIISSASDADLFQFTAAAGTVSFTVSPFTVTSSTVSVLTPGNDLDVRADILDTDGAAVAGLSSDPSNNAVASISGTLPAAGIYHLRVRGAGNLSPLTTGFSTYGSIGSYTITGNVPAAVTGTLSFASASQSAAEGSADHTVSITIQRSATAAATTVDYATADQSAVAGTHYESTSGTLTWLAGDADAKTIAVTVHGNTTVDTDRTFTVTLSNPGNGFALGFVSTTTVTIANDDVTPTISFTNSVLNTPEGSVDHTVSLSVQRSTATATSVDYTTANQSAVAGTQYESTSGTLTWLAGDSNTKTISITVHGNALVDIDRTFTVTLSNPGNGFALGSIPTTTVTLTNDDAAVVTPTATSGSGGGGGGGGCGAGTAAGLFVLAGLFLVRRRRS